MEKEYIFKDIQKLITPVGDFFVSDGGNEITFSVIKNGFDLPSEVYDNEGNVIGTIHTDFNYSIIIESKKLELGKEYTIQFSGGNWKYCSSDENTTCYCTTIEQWCVGIGAYDPNDILKDEQMWEYSKKEGFLERRFCMDPPEYDESNFERYTVEVTEDLRGYKFKLFDYDSEYIWFEVAWINIVDYPAIEYEEALGFWLC